MGEPAALVRIAAVSGWRAGRQLGRGQYGTAYLVEWTGQKPSTGSNPNRSDGGLQIGGGDGGIAIMGGVEEEGVLDKDFNVGEEAVAKVVGLEFLREKEQSLAFQEVTFMRKMRHPHIVSLVDHFVTEASLELVIVMEFCEGGDLREEVKRRSQTKPPSHFPEVQIMTWFVQLTLALNYMHQRQILHRDLKTSNIFLTMTPESGYALKIGDFGIARVLEGTIAVAATVVGTPYYMSPEVCKSEPYGFKSDIWALGCVLYELCMLKHAFQSQSLLGLVYKIVSETYEPIPKQYSEELRALIDHVLDKSHFTRPSGKDLVADPFVRRFVAQCMEATSPCPDPKLELPAREQPQPRSRVQQQTNQVQQLHRPPPPRASLQRAAQNIATVPPGSLEAFAPAKGIQHIPLHEEEPARRQWCTPEATAPLDERDLRAQVLLRRIQLALATRRQNWLQVFACFDRAGNGQLQDAEFEQAITSMALGLSDNEIREVRTYLQGPGIRVPVDCFGAALLQTSEEVQQMESWGRDIIGDLTREASRIGGENAIVAGAQVRIQGFESTVGRKLNGTEGVIDKWDAPASCWVVRLTDGALTPIRDEHLHVTKVVAQAPQAGGPSLVPDTTALYRVLCAGGETAVPEYRFLDVVRRLLPQLTEAERYRLLLLVPKSPEGRVDVPEALSQFVLGGAVCFQRPPSPMKPKKTYQVLPGPGLSPSKPGPSATAKHVSGVVPGEVPSPRVNMHAQAPPQAAMHTKTKESHFQSTAVSSSTKKVHVDMVMLRLAQKLLARAVARGPGLEVLLLFAPKRGELRLDDLFDAVSVLPLGISRAEVQSVFTHLCSGMHPARDVLSMKTISFNTLSSAIEAAYDAGIPSEAAVLEHVDLKRLSAALQRLGVADGCNGRASPQEFRVKVMQAEPYLTPCQLDLLMMLTDKDGEGALLPFSLLLQLGLTSSTSARVINLPILVPPRPVGCSRAPVAPNTPRSVVVAAIFARIRDNLCAAGQHLHLDRVVGLFDDDGKMKPTRDILASLLGHLRLGISAAEADELVGCTCVGMGLSTGQIQISRLYEALVRADEPDSQNYLSELRSEASSLLLGRGIVLAKAVTSLDAGEWILECDFRRCLLTTLTEDGLPTASMDVDMFDRILLLANKNVVGDVRWRLFLEEFAGLRDSDSWSECSTRSAEESPKRGPKPDKAEPSMTAQSWRTTKLQQAAGKSGTNANERPNQTQPSREYTGLPRVRGGPCRCLSRWFG